MVFLDKEKTPERLIEQNKEIIRPTWIEIDRAAFEHNIMSYKSIVKPALLAPVIKSNAYGHGIAPIAKICDQHESVDLICVVSLSEALLLRSQGIKKPILVLSIVDGDLDEAIAYDIDLVVYDLAMALELNHIGSMLNKKAQVHVKVDTGLSRLGLLQGEAITFIETLHHLPFINIRGMFTHFASSESTDQTYTNQQLENFNFVIQQIEAKGIVIPLKHTSCSAAITANLGSHFTMVRAGIGMYGLWSSDENKQVTKENYPQFSLRSVLTWKTRVIHIKEIPADSYVGYDLTYQADKATRIATLPVGYWDGYDRGLSNKGKVLINNHLVPIVGRVAMNLTMIDVTGLDVAVGNEVTLLGNHAGVTADDMARHCGTINYEVVTRINPLLPRIIR